MYCYAQPANLRTSTVFVLINYNRELKIIRILIQILIYIRHARRSDYNQISIRPSSTLRYLATSSASRPCTAQASVRDSI